MSKALVHFTLLAMFFFGTWFLLGKVDFVGFFHIEQLTKDNERKLGAFILGAVKQGNEELQSDSVQTCLDSIKKRLCAANDIEDSSVTIHILIKNDVNAFALPGRHLVVYTGLIHYGNSAEEISGVLAHEIAHMKLQHVMKKLIKEVGFSILATIAGGESGGEIMRETVRLLSSTAFDRDQETEADLSAVHMMAKANIDPEALANFLFRLSQEKNDIPKHFEWLSTHPNSRDRSAEILKLRKRETYHPAPITVGVPWGAIKRMVERSHED